MVQKGGVSVAEGLTAFSAAYVSASIIGPFAGRLSDRLRRRRLFLLFGEAASLPFFILIPTLNSFLLITLCFVAAESILSFGTTALQAFVADITLAGERGRGYGFVSAVGSAGSAVGTLGAGVVAELFGLDYIFCMVGFLMGGTILLVLVAIPESTLPSSDGKR